jgi:hypothetical protein
VFHSKAIIPGSVAASLVRRGFFVARSQLQGHDDNPSDELQKEIIRRLQKPSTIIALGLTFLTFVLLSGAVEYAIRIVACNLAITEDTQGGSIKLPASNEPDAPLEKEPLLDETEIEKQANFQTVPSKPITRKLRTTFQHLSSVAGFRARFRGLVYLAIYGAMSGSLTALFKIALHQVPAGRAIAAVFAAIISARLHCAWTHATIAAPSNKTFCQRFLARADSKHLILPTIRLVVGQQVSKLVVCAAVMYTRDQFKARGQTESFATLAPLAILPIGAALFAGLAVLLPNHIALIRTEASLLPEDEDAIVPLDRTFGGRVVNIAAPSRKVYVRRNLTLPGAWMSFDRETFRRVFGLHMKMGFILFAITLVFVHVAAFEIWTIFGDLVPQVVVLLEAQNQWAN